MPRSGYINFTPRAEHRRSMKRRSTISLQIDIDEGKQFYVRRIEFQGNTTTRDKVIRRELALEEGQVYNGQLWELSLLRLNQLQYFEAAQARAGFGSQAEPAGRHGRHHPEGEGKGQEQYRTDRRRQRPGRRSFIGMNYTTNNFFGKGETLTLKFQTRQYQRNGASCSASPSLPVRPSAAVGLARYITAVQLQPGGAHTDPV